MSKMYVETIIKQADPYLAACNLDESLKCPRNWELFEDSAIKNRYAKDTAGDFRTFLRTNEFVKLNITTGEYKTLIRPKLSFYVYIVSDSGTADVYIKSGPSDSYIKSVPTNTKTLVEVNLYTNSEYIIIKQNSPANTMYVYQDVEVSYKTTPIDITNEFTQFNINPNLRDDITIGNTVHQRKTGKTIIGFTNQLIIKPNENKEILDVTSFGRLNRRLQLVWINDSENSGDTLANMPQAGGYQKYYLVNYVSAQKTGLYEYATISYQNDPLNGIY